MVKPTNEGYLGNTLIKRAGVETQYTKEELEEYRKLVLWREDALFSRVSVRIASL